MKPAIAILAFEERNRLRGNKKLFIDLMKTGRKLGTIVYVTTVRDLDLSGKKIVGYVYDENKKTWTSRLFPFPHVIYNRIPYRKYEKRPEVQQAIRACFSDRRLSLFNPFFFDKWKLFEWLSRSEKTRPFLPKTERLLSSENLDSLFEYGCSMLYVKPIRGKAGNGIMRVDRKKTDTGTEYRIAYVRSGRRETVACASVSELWEILKGKIGRKEYIVQQGIELVQYRNRPFDLRLLVQKNGRGRWAITGIGARVAGKRSITTHVPRGGSIRHPEELLQSLFGVDKTTEMLRNAGKSALAIASRIEKGAGRMLGEMSMDLGVDTNGRFWFFEANSKPMKFDEPSIRHKSLRRLIEYCMFLSMDRDHETGPKKLRQQN